MRIDIQFACEDAGVPEAQVIRNWVQLAAEQSGRAPDAETDLAVRIVGAAEIQTLNMLYR